MMTVSDFLWFGTLIVSVIALVYEITKDLYKRK